MSLQAQTLQKKSHKYPKTEDKLMRVGNITTASPEKTESEVV